MLRWNGCHRTSARFSMNQNLAIAAYSVLTARSHVRRSRPDRPVCRSDAPPLPAALVVEVTKPTRIGAVEMGRGAIVDWQLAPRAGFCALSRAGVHESVTVRSRRAGNFCRTAGACCRYLLLRCTWRQRGFGRGFVPLRVGQPNRHGSYK